MAVYITAHPDDWQLFMGSDACADVQRAGGKAIFICLTGGQANEPGDTFWLGREAAFQAAVQKAANLSVPASNVVPTTCKITVKGHSVLMQRYRNTVAYSLRLPDGNLDGKGQARGGYQSMRQLFKDGRFVTPLDGSLSYVSWDDLIQTVQRLLKKEVGEAKVSVHASQPDERYNPRDHSDHRMAGEVALAATNKIECRTLLYVGYDSRRRPINLQPEQAANQRAVYQAYSETMTSHGQPSGWEFSHLQFIGRQYSQVRHKSGQQLGDSIAIPRVVPSTVGGQGDGKTYTSLTLEPNYPNPFDRSSLMAYQMPAAGAVWLRILDVQGREIVRMLHGEQQQAGRHEQWLDVNSFPAAGLYIAELRVGDERRTCRLQIIR
ncbi:T9SS type A sorting domain-containing protein [Hymenobacter taeanensis]|uniref:T9SS type A sorting domain-containing protein n=1 Tax=Hymenobacter taeanensis TaxID=2735321 RepID=A0A6M6BGK6_9BACT|nr:MULTISPECIES: PIG-L family deacetylase [Hymenobacter]QJX46924.1 T9SS type A sorting domain-containing protein [Hymenobacter taeanensis]UOQ80799.1 PIG-L family deacetylase [Hymenobacter sp. 5414T-23]